MNNRREEGAMSTTHREVQSLIRTLSENYTMENIQYHLFVIEKVKRGIEKAEEKGLIPRDTGNACLKNWIKSYFNLLRE
jgi:hypothetical protein